MTIFFDAVGTLIHLPQGPAWHYCHIAARHGWAPDLEQMQSAFGRAWKSQPPRPATGQPRPGDDRPWWEALVQQVLTACGVPAGLDRAAYFAELYEFFATGEPWAVYPEVLEVLTQLQGQHRLAVLSNFDLRLHCVLRELGLARFFEQVFVSSQVGADKPAPEIFHHALHSMGIAAADALHVGDEPALDGAGAAAAGVRCFLVDRPSTTLRDVLPLVAGPQR